MSADAISYSTTELTAIDLPPEIEIPPAPTSIARPAMPVIATGEIDEDITIAPTTFEGNPVSELPPPPSLEKVLDEQDLHPLYREARCEEQGGGTKGPGAGVSTHSSPSRARRDRAVVVLH
jgi:hypothetical protein